MVDRWEVQYSELVLSKCGSNACPSTTPVAMPSKQKMIESVVQINGISQLSLFHQEQH